MRSVLFIFICTQILNLTCMFSSRTYEFQLSVCSPESRLSVFEIRVYTYNGPPFVFLPSHYSMGGEMNK